MQIVDALGEDGLLRYWGKTLFIPAARNSVDVDMSLRLFVRHRPWHDSCSNVSGQGRPDGVGWV